MNTSDMYEFDFEVLSEDAQLAYIKPVGCEEAHRLGLLPPGLELPQGAQLYVVHSSDGRVLGATDTYEMAYGTAVRHEFTPVSLH